MTSAVTNLKIKQRDRAISLVEAALYAWLLRSFGSSIKYSWDVIGAHKATTRIETSLTQRLDSVAVAVEDAVAMQLGIFDGGWA